jgi:outer membrane protein OmpA-like peptidoglycan-associated protein
MKRFVLIAAFLGIPAFAQTDNPSVEQMVEKLAPRTRSMRNLVPVEVVPATVQPTQQSGSALSTQQSAQPSIQQPAQPSIQQTVQPLIQQPAGQQLPVQQVQQPSQQTQPTAAQQMPSAVVGKIDLTVHFDFNSDKIQGRSKPLLDKVVQVMTDQRLEALRFRVEGHTDAKGGAAYNDSLSKRRADAVVIYLAQQGVQTARLKAQGKGFRELADSADPSSGLNRRVTIVSLE